MSTKNYTGPRKYWHAENLPTDAIILYRNLASANSVNIRHLYEDALQEQKETRKTQITSGSGKKGKKGTLKSKKQIIIEQNEANMKQKRIQEDQKRLNAFKKEGYTHFERWLSYLKTSEVSAELKFDALQKAFQDQNPVTTLELYLQLQDYVPKSKSDREWLVKIKDNIVKWKTKRMQMKMLGNRLPPLDFYNRATFRLDDWQIQVLKFLQKNKSVLVCAPTSSGKTVLSTYFATLHKTVLYVVPSKPLAFQVSAIFHKIAGGGVGTFVKDFSFVPEGGLRVAVGTPLEIESRLPTLEDFDLAVFDEIHNLNHDEGEAYERLIKWHRNNFLALSATIRNPEQLQEWLQKLDHKRRVEVVTYQKRFINVQRHVWDQEKQKVVKLHPLSCFNEKDLSTNDLPSIAFTPWDSISAWMQLKTHLPSDVYTKLDPEVYFKHQDRITLDDTKTYEENIKKTLVNLSTDQKTELLKTHYCEEPALVEQFSLLPFFSNLQKKDMLPGICFNLSSINCRDIFRHLVSELETQEAEMFPYHYENAAHRQQLYQEYNKRREHLSSECKEIDREHRLMQFDNKEIGVYQKELTERYQFNIDALKKRCQGLGLDPLILKKQLSNLKKEYEYEMEHTTINETDIFEKHPDYCFSLTPMKAERIRSIRKEIISKTGIRIDYESSLIQGLKRGIGLYTKSLPDVYLRIVQELAQNRELGVVISDPSLALGINMPFRTSIIMGWKDQTSFTPLLYHQMSGRAGRRGMDSEGHVVFANVKWKGIMKGNLEEISGKKEHPFGYSLLSLYKESFAPRAMNVQKNYLCEFTNSTKSIDKPTEPEIYPEEWTPVSLRIAWKLRQYGARIYPFAQSFDQMEVYLKSEGSLGNNQKNCHRLLKYTVNGLLSSEPNLISFDRLDTLDSHPSISDLVEVLKTGHISQEACSEYQFRMVNQVIEVGEIVKLIHNTVCGKSFYQATERVLATAFDHCRHIVFSYHSLNE